MRWAGVPNLRFPKTETSTLVHVSISLFQRKGEFLTFPPIPPDELLHGIDADVERVHVLDRYVAFPQVPLVDLEGVSGTGWQEQCDHEGRPRGRVMSR